jgi:hypothetical protein
MSGSKKMKYVRMKRCDEIIIFPEVIQHKDFNKFEIVSAGFCYIHTGEQPKIVCFGESVSLNLTSKEEDSEIATRHFFYDY